MSQHEIRSSFLSTLFRPSIQAFPGSSSFESALDAFEDFWDSGYPRIGEKSARGWKNARPAGAEAATSTVNPSSEDISDPYIRWSRLEEHLGVQDRLPARAEDLDGQDRDRDPYRVVLFDDLRPLLFDVVSTRGRQLMIFSALGLLGLLINVPAVSVEDMQYDIPNISSAEMFGPQEAGLKTLPWEAAGGPQPVKAMGANTPVKHWATELETLFAIDWFADFDQLAMKRLDHQIIRCVLSPEAAVCDADLALASCLFCAALLNRRQRSTGASMPLSPQSHQKRECGLGIGRAASFCAQSAEPLKLARPSSVRTGIISISGSFTLD